MDDLEILGRVDSLIDEEHRLREAHGAGNPLGDDERERLRQLEVELDRCWDLLRQRRARRNAGLDPEDTEARDAGTVEHYRQ